MFRKCSICQNSLCVKWIVPDVLFAGEPVDEETELNFMNLTQTNIWYRTKSFWPSFPFRQCPIHKRARVV